MKVEVRLVSSPRIFKIPNESQILDAVGKAVDESPEDIKSALDVLPLGEGMGAVINGTLELITSQPKRFDEDKLLPNFEGEHIYIAIKDGDNDTDTDDADDYF